MSAGAPHFPPRPGHAAPVLLAPGEVLIRASGRRGNKRAIEIETLAYAIVLGHEVHIAAATPEEAEETMRAAVERADTLRAWIRAESSW